MNPEVMDARLAVLHQDVTDVKVALKELTGAITRLALVEERMAIASQAQERAFKAMGELERRLVEIEKKLPEYSKASIWIDRGIYATVAASLTYLLKKLEIL